MLALVIASQIVTKVLKVKWEATKWTIILHALFHFGILYSILYVSHITDIWSILMAGVYYLSSFLISENLFLTQNIKKTSIKKE